MTVINNTLSLKELLSYHNVFDYIEDTSLEKYAMLAYLYVSKKLRLKPIILSLNFTQNETINILGGSIPYEGNLIQFKGIIDVFGNKKIDSPLSDVNDDVMPEVLDALKEPTGSYYWDGHVLSGNGVVNVLGYAYPILDKEQVSPVLGFALVAMMYYHLLMERGDALNASHYEVLATKYINLYNQNIVEPKISNLTVSTRIKTYEL